MSDYTSGPVEADWIKYSAVLPPDAGPVQVEETRRAFYAGAFSLFHRIMLELEPGADATEPDVALLDAIHHELSTWAALEALLARSKNVPPEEGG